MVKYKDLTIIVSICIVAVVLALCGCTTSSPQASPTPAPTTTAGFPMNVTDNFGRVITLSHAPERIVSLSPANTEILFALGAGNKLVGGTDYDDYPAEAKNVTHVSGFSGVSYEKIGNASPDVIFAEDITSEDAVNKLTSMGYPVIILKNSNMTNIEKNILLMGKVTGKEANATAIVKNIDDRMAAITAKAASLNDSQKPSVLLLVGYVPGESIYVYGSNTYGDDLIRQAGGKNTAANVNEFAVMSSEAIASADPDYIIVPVDGLMTTTDSFNAFKNGSLPWMANMKAYKNGHIIMVDGNLMERPGPRLPDAGLAIARAIHPELFS
ncbi:MAG TPA: ABC transporter substrate-binding protein [Methanocella sp.]|uniref:ABC transporter substrate-binding protein n=1 Tax=Methanocella sp. TaxID=2052833 RepID=UPI002CC327CA|nr:ABC transporter substrate-binding protein [Methanocella sp.]HTY90552.1 ABC transporter substrate-binding protein [Methanocella sp.]